MTLFQKPTIFLIITQLLLSNIALAQTKSTTTQFNVKEIVLPSEVEQVQKLSGSVYYNKSTKGKVLIPVNYWGQVSRPGLHFIPAETNFITGLSMAGGPSTQSKLENIKLIRKGQDGLKIKSFDLTEGGSEEAYRYKLQQHDTVFVERSTFYEDRSYYTGLISVFVTVLSGYVLYEQVQKNK
jgi:hypothetical protein